MNKWDDKTIVTWGVGKVGRRGLVLLHDLGIKPDYVCDSNSKFWGDTILPFAPSCVSPATVVNSLQDNNVFCFIMVGKNIAPEVISTIQEYGWEYMTYDEFLRIDIVFDYYFRNSTGFEYVNDIVDWTNASISPIKKRQGNVAVYKCITGKYDDFCVGADIINPNFDYYLISDVEPGNKTEWNYIDINRIISEHYDNRLRARCCKINGSRIFQEYDYSIYLDGNVTIIGNIDWMLSRIGITGMAIYNHPERRGGTFEEAIVCIQHEKDRKEIIQRQMIRYLNEGMPRNLGVYETTCLVRENKNADCIQICDDWWEELSNNSIRDQLSLMYCVWKNGFLCEDIGFLGNDVRNGPGISVRRHSKD